MFQIFGRAAFENSSDLAVHYDRLGLGFGLSSIILECGLGDAVAAGVQKVHRDFQLLLRVG